MLSGIVFVNHNGLRWRDAPSAYGPHKTLYDGGTGCGRYRAGDRHDRRDIPEGAPHGIKPAGKKGDFGRLIGRTKGGMNTKLHAVADANGRPLSFFMTAGQVRDYTGAAALLDDLPKAQWLLGDRGHDADWFRDAPQAKGIQPCIPGRRSRNKPVRYDKRRYRRRSRIEIMFGRLKDWRRVATRYDRCPMAFSPPSPSSPPSSPGCDQRVSTLEAAIPHPTNRSVRPSRPPKVSLEALTNYAICLINFIDTQKGNFYSNVFALGGTWRPKMASIIICTYYAKP